VVCGCTYAIGFTSGVDALGCLATSICVLTGLIVCAITDSVVAVAVYVPLLQISMIADAKLDRRLDVTDLGQSTATLCVIWLEYNVTDVSYRFVSH
jgi:hypothetical protein